VKNLDRIVTAISSAGRRKASPAPSRDRSAITNGSKLLGAEVDHRSAWMRRYRDLIQAHLSDLGGEAEVSEAEKVLVRRAAMLTLQLELLERRFAGNESGEASPAQIETYQRCTNTLRRMLEALGLKRRAREIPPRGDATSEIVRAIEGRGYAL
jgi:hypothetical protein